jgi:hypothetical protein
MRKWIVIGVLILAVAAFVVLRYISGGGGRDYVLRRLNQREIVVRRSCGTGEVYVDPARWRDLSAREQERAASALASWCAEQGGASTIAVLDSYTRATLGRWNGNALERP